jgi:hypothetical protein
MKTKLLRVTRIAFLLAIVAVALTSATKSSFTVHDKSFYASSAAVDFVRPGLVVKVLAAAIAQDGTITAKVSFSDPQGLPLDKDGVLTPGAISGGNPGVVADVMPRDKTQFTAYTTRTETDAVSKRTAIQAGADSGGTWTKVADGVYTYTFKTKAPPGFDARAVHAIGVYANRVLTEFNLGTDLDDDVYYFIPSTGAQAPNPRDVATDAHVTRDKDRRDRVAGLQRMLPSGRCGNRHPHLLKEWSEFAQYIVVETGERQRCFDGHHRLNR